MLEVIDCHDSMVVKVFRKDLINGTLFYDSLTMRTPKKMVDVLSRAYVFVKLEDDQRMTMGDIPYERSNRYQDIRRNVLIVEVPENQNSSGGRPQSKAPVSTNIHFVPKSSKKRNEVPDPFKQYDINVSISNLVKHLQDRKSVR